MVALGLLSFLGWMWLSGWDWKRLTDVDPMSSVGLVLVAAVVGVACLFAWVRDWRTLRVLRRHLSSKRTRR